MQRERLTVEFPENFRCHITTKVGKPLGKSRTSVGKPTELTVASDTTFGVVSALVVDNVSAAIADYHADTSNAKLLWDPQVPTEVYVKVAANTTHDKRATSNNLVTAAVRVAGYIEDQSLALGPLQSDYVTVVTARLPPSAPVEIPTNATMQQLGHIDVMAARHADERRHEMNSQTTEKYRRVRVRFGTMASAPVDCFLLVEDLRSILGIPPFDLTPSYREPFVGEVVARYIGPLQTDYATVVTARLPPSAPVKIPTNATMQQLGHIDVMAARHEMNSQTTEKYPRYIGPLQTDYATVVTARLPPSAPVKIPTNATMQQLGHIDVMAARHEMNSQTTEKYRRVRVRFGTMASAPVDCFLLVEDLRSILGIPPFDLTPSYREPFVGEVVGPSVNMDDIDHINL
ncbi:hypothetical protein H257_04297 [Aphanomyces astaci]|uniref:Uncharacterized protein n=1 Tax=Aphanomyces astaci TaxID=112090 RepID=W4GV64_APHAT|nr:hypothetical protein H257_04297 [Aphanomyces astaci]ETV83600.1 hypothetical protein H257_04297 [Aphanomyces astaci]|eukprot:XP_009827030.1 hypothetical protein H257_04297 [Aphanomyces astaci]